MHSVTKATTSQSNKAGGKSTTDLQVGTRVHYGKMYGKQGYKLHRIFAH